MTTGLNSCLGKIKWCLRQDKGITVVEPDLMLSNKYFFEAKDTLKVIECTYDKSSNIWLSAQLYYTYYFLAYAILVKIGIKSEIHSCTIELIKYLQYLDYVNFNFYVLLKNAKKIREKNQYYLENFDVVIDNKELHRIIINVKEVLDNLTMNEVLALRFDLKKVFNHYNP